MLLSVGYLKELEVYTNEILEVKDSSGNSYRLCQKHPDPATPLKSALFSGRELRKLEDTEFTGGHILQVACQIQ